MSTRPVNSAQFLKLSGNFSATDLWLPFFTLNNHALCLLLFKHFFRFKYFLKLVLWRFKASLLKTKVVAELVTSLKQYPVFWLIPVHQSISDDLLSHMELDVNHTSRKILIANILLVLGSIASSTSLDLCIF